MSKFTFVVAGTAGVGAAGVGGFFLLGGSETPKTKFKEKYSHALITDSDSLWDSKFALLKATNSDPKHPKLLESFQESKKSDKENDAKELMKRTCLDLYEESINESYVKDFEKYCVKNNKDASKVTWNDDVDSSNKWDSSLSTLKSHNDKDSGELDEDLKKLKTKIASISNYDNTHRNELKQWCEKVKDYVYWGSESKEFKQQELYCKKT